MSELNYGMESFDVHTFDPCQRPRRIARPTAAFPAVAKQAPKPADVAKAQDPKLMEALLAEVAARREGMIQLERRVEQLSHELRRVQGDQDNPALAIHFTPAAGFGKPSL